ncbi:MAG: hypothetical protein M3P04_01275 [Actinomycetota bacterium]|nr:hypothetical protein [Actinomycetota bacterium]
MTVLQLPPPRPALRHPAVRAAVLVLLVGPVWVAWLGKADDAPVRLRVLGLAVVMAAALAWDDREHALTASTPVGLPAVRRGRIALVLVVLALAFGLGCLAVPDGLPLPAGALVLQTGALVAVLMALMGWFGRAGESVLVLPAPALLLTLLVLTRLPHQIGMLRADPMGDAWAAERTRWVVLLVVAALTVVRLGRDPAAR